MTDTTKNETKKAKARREPADARCAWRKMTAAERAEHLQWIKDVENGDAK